MVPSPNESYESWESRLSSRVEYSCGMPLDCLPDTDTYGMYESGLNVREAATLVLMEVGFPI